MRRSWVSTRVITIFGSVITTQLTNGPFESLKPSSSFVLVISSKYWGSPSSLNSWMKAGPASPEWMDASDYDSAAWEVQARGKKRCSSSSGAHKVIQKLLLYSCLSVSPSFVLWLSGLSLDSHNIYSQDKYSDADSPMLVEDSTSGMRSHTRHHTYYLLFLR
jgi:hypothetical protein